MRRAALMLVVVVGGCSGDKPTQPQAPPTSTVSISPDDPTLSVGSTITLAATPRDAAGAVVGGRSVAWTTSRADVATVNATSGVVTAVGEGFTVVRATIDQKFDEVLVTVILPVASVGVTGRRTNLDLGGTMQLLATMRDARGVVLIGRSVTWSTSDGSKAQVAESGVVTGVAAGTVTITARSEGVAGNFVLTVADFPAPQISSISPPTLSAGITATIAGENFDAVASDIDVTVSGTPVVVTAASQNQLTVQIPAAFPCQPTGNVAVNVAGSGGTGTRQHPLQVAQLRNVEIGQALVLTGVDVRCNELPVTPARYALAVINTTRSPAAMASFDLRGLVAAAPTAAVTTSVAPLRWTGAPGTMTLRANPFRRYTAALGASVHQRWLEQERALARQLGGSPRRARRLAATSNGAARVSSATSMNQAAAAAVPLEVGATTTLKIRTSDSNCNDSRAVPARVVYVGPKSVILESADAPLAGTMDADYVALGTEYDNVMHAVLLQYFGNPVAYDASTDNNGRIVMLFTKAINDRAANLLGFVTVCDFFPPSTPGAAASNQAEIFYARVPTTTGTNVRDIETRRGWMHIMRGTLIHEAKHITSYAERFATPEEADLEESWLEEATAQAAIELWGRATYYAGKAPWKGNATYANTMYCDVHTDEPACNAQPSIVSDHFLFLYGYYENVPTRSFFSSASADNSVYGSGWLFTRWAADHHAGDEASFFQALTRSWTQTGLANIEARIGRPFTSFHPEFMLSLFADDLPGFTPVAGTRFTIPTWNTRDIFLGMSGDFTRGGQPVAAWPLRVQTTQFGAFTAGATSLAGGGAAFIELSGTPTVPQTIALRGASGSTLPTETPLRLAILRVE